MWPGPSLQALDRSEWPTDRKALEKWALSRADSHFQKCWDDVVRDWESLTNRVGTSDSADISECREMVENGIRMHLDQVERCLNSLDSDTLESWRGGSNRPEWPAPDGFPLLWSEPHPCAQEPNTEPSWTEAWEIARPWFVDPDADSFTQTTSHPEGWFQGEYDLVYRWTGRPFCDRYQGVTRKGDVIGGYLEQLRLYAWLWWETHDRSEEVESHPEIWYLGPGKVKGVELPSLDELEEYSDELKDLYFAIRQESIFGRLSADPSPLQVLRFRASPLSPIR